MKIMSYKHLIVIDPAVQTAEVENFNRLATRAPQQSTYHLPAMMGLESLKRESVEQAAGIIIFGSAASVNDDHSWQRPLEIEV